MCIRELQLKKPQNQKTSQTSSTTHSDHVDAEIRVRMLMIHNEALNVVLRKNETATLSSPTPPA